MLEQFKTLEHQIKILTEQISKLQEVNVLSKTRIDMLSKRIDDLETNVEKKNVKTNVENVMTNVKKTNVKTNENDETNVIMTNVKNEKTKKNEKTEKKNEKMNVKEIKKYLTSIGLKKHSKFKVSVIKQLYDDHLNGVSLNVIQNNVDILRNMKKDEEIIIANIIPEDNSEDTDDDCSDMGIILTDYFDTLNIKELKKESKLMGLTNYSKCSRQVMIDALKTFQESNKFNALKNAQDIINVNLLN